MIETNRQTKQQLIDELRQLATDDESGGSRLLLHCLAELTLEQCRAVYDRLRDEHERETPQAEPICVLKDQAASEAARRVPVFIRASASWLEIRPAGYGEADAVDGCGSPVLLELHDGRLRLVISPDINSDEKTVIDLEEAREDRRRQRELFLVLSVDNEEQQAYWDLVPGVNADEAGERLAGLRPYATVLDVLEVSQVEEIAANMLRTSLEEAEEHLKTIPSEQ